MILFLGCFLLMVLHPVIAGATEAVLYSRQGSMAFTWDEHLLYLAGRAIIVGLVLATINLTIFDRVMLAICWIFCYALPHDEIYYFTRAKIDGKPYRYGYQSPTSTAKVELNKVERLILMLIGLACLIVYMYIRF